MTVVGICVGFVLAGGAASGHRFLHLVRCVLHDRTPGVDRFGHRDAAGLTDAHRGAHVDLEEHPLDRHDVGAEGLGVVRAEEPPGLAMSESGVEK